MPIFRVFAFVVFSASSAWGGSAGEKIWVDRPDGSLQCSHEKAQSSLKQGARALERAGVRVLGSRKISDMRPRIQLCGAPSGILDSYKIRRSDLEKAEKLGFSGR